ncbi:MAG TPA: LytTR family DNA-binding domain-containing protein [Flavisolibacter sp.]|nr:LytTR family DNA-binding domain-containing protein [Flavisolibacter sp.]
MRWKCLIIDDEPVARKILQEFVEDVPFLELSGMAENPVRAGLLLHESPVDLMFLDINMPKMNGLQFLKTSASLPLAIMTTAYSDYALEGFDLNVLDYLVKPFSFERFLKACNKADAFLQLKHKTNAPLDAAGYFFVKCDGVIEKIMYKELIWVEARQNYIVLHTESRSLIVYLTLKGISDELPETQFLKVHKSVIVNIEKIKSLEGNTINLGSASVLISQNLYPSVMKAILKDRMIKR